MDIGTDWAVSPSKARVYQAQAKDWASVDAWLLKKYTSKRLPTFERNEETLEALLTLASLNENADEQQSHIDRVEKAALVALRNRSTNENETYQFLSAHLEDCEDLAILAETSVCLDCTDVGVSTMASAIVDLTARKFEQEQQLQRVETQLNALKSEQRRVSTLLQELHQDALQPPDELLEQTAGWVRSAKHLRAKVGEYDERLVAARSAQPSGSRIDDVAQQTTSLKEQQAHLAELYGSLKAFQSLPTNAKDARAMLESARADLLRVTRERDRLFESLADAG